MKSILKNALVGLLLVAGTTKPVATQTDVEAALIKLIPSDGKVVDSALKANLGNLDVSYAWWLGAQINNELTANAKTKKCTIKNGLGGFFYYVRTLQSDHITDTATKLIVITEDGCKKTVCGIQFALAANGDVTATYKTPAETTALLEKGCVQTERTHVSAYQIPMGKTAWGLAFVAGLTGLYFLMEWKEARAIARAIAVDKQQRLFGRLGL